MLEDFVPLDNLGAAVEGAFESKVLGGFALIAEVITGIKSQQA